MEEEMTTGEYIAILRAVPDSESQTCPLARAIFLRSTTKKNLYPSIVERWISKPNCATERRMKTPQESAAGAN